MKSIIKLTSAAFIMIAITFLSANAEVWLNEQGDYQTDADKFVSQKKVNVRHSFLANKMEDATRNAMNKENAAANTSKNQNFNGLFNKQNSSNRNYKKTYKWF